jgi:hypothetical protein
MGSGGCSGSTTALSYDPWPLMVGGRLDLPTKVHS